MIQKEKLFMSRGMYLFLGIVQLLAGGLIAYDGISEHVLIRILTGICFLFAGICNFLAWRRMQHKKDTDKNH